MISFSYTDSRESLLSTNRQLMQEREQLQSQVAILNAQVSEMEAGQMEALVAAAVSQVMSRAEAKLLKIIEDQGREIAELRRDVAPLRAEREAKIEAQRIALEKSQQEKKEAALLHFIHLRNNGWALTQQVEYIQSMNPEEIDYVLQEKGRFSNISNIMRRITAEGWDKERLLKPWR